MNKIGHGIFNWQRDERVTNRYGAVHLGNESYKGGAACTPFLDRVLLNKYEGKRVRLLAEVIEARESGHIGDLFLGVFPSQPEVGDCLEIGVGGLALSGEEIVLAPDDGRQELWLDPCVLYRLHDQTVDLYVEATQDPPHAAPVLEQAEPDGAMGADSEGGIQLKHTQLEDVDLRMQFERIGDELYIGRSPEVVPGKRVPTKDK